MKKTFSAMLVMLSASAMAATGTVNNILQDDGVWPGPAGGYNEFIVADDSDPNGLVALASASASAFA